MQKSNILENSILMEDFREIVKDAMESIVVRPERTHKMESRKILECDGSGIMTILEKIKNKGFNPHEVKIGVFWEEKIFSPDCGVYAYINESTPLSPKEIEKEKEMDFRRRAFKAVYHRAIRNGFKRISTTRKQDEELGGKNPYWYYKEKNWDVLARYYAHAFRKESHE